MLLGHLHLQRCQANSILRQRVLLLGCGAGNISCFLEAMAAAQLIPCVEFVAVDSSFSAFSLACEQHGALDGAHTTCDLADARMYLKVRIKTYSPPCVSNNEQKCCSYNVRFDVIVTDLSSSCAKANFLAAPPNQFLTDDIPSLLHGAVRDSGLVLCNMLPWPDGVGCDDPRPIVAHVQAMFAAPFALASVMTSIHGDTTNCLTILQPRSEASGTQDCCGRANRRNLPAALDALTSLSPTASPRDHTITKCAAGQFSELLDFSVPLPIVTLLSQHDGDGEAVLRSMSPDVIQSLYQTYAKETAEQTVVHRIPCRGAAQ